MELDCLAHQLLLAKPAPWSHGPAPGMVAHRTSKPRKAHTYGQTHHAKVSDNRIFQATRQFPVNVSKRTIYVNVHNHQLLPTQRHPRLNHPPYPLATSTKCLPSERSWSSRPSWWLLCQRLASKSRGLASGKSGRKEQQVFAHCADTTFRCAWNTS